MQAKSTARRSYGTGRLFVREDQSGAETWVGQWRTPQQQFKRVLGPKRRPSTSEGLTKAQAEQRLRELMAAAKAEEPRRQVRTSGKTIGQLAEAYFASRDLKASTLTDYRMHVRLHLAPFFEGKAIDRISAEDIERLIAELQTRRLKVRTVRSYVTTLSTLLGYAQRKRWIRENPMTSVDLPPLRQTGEEEPLRFLRPFEVIDLANAAQPGDFQQLDRAMFVTAAMTGLRQGELRALRWENIDSASARLHVVGNIVRGQHTSPKSRKTRSVPLASIVAAELEALRNVSPRTGPQDFVFADPATGQPVPRTQMMERYRAALRAAGLDPAFRWHDLRHTFGTSMAKAGEPVTNIQAWMGHADLATTQRYMHYSPAVDEAGRVDRAFALGDPRAEEAPEPVAAFVAAS